MIAKTALEPLDPSVSQRYAEIVTGAIAGHYALPESVGNWISSLNLATTEAAKATVAANAFGLDWQQRVASERAGSLSIAALQTPLTAATLESLATEMAQLTEQARLANGRRLAFGEVALRLADLDKSIFSEDTILPSLREALEQVFVAVRSLPPDAPRSAEAALAESMDAQGAYRRLQAVQSRYRAIVGAWRALRGNPVLPDSEDGNELFGDTPIWPALRAPTINLLAFAPAGPPPGLDRLVWLSLPGNAWLPSVAAENECYRNFRLAASQRPEDRRAPASTETWVSRPGRKQTA